MKLYVVRNKEGKFFRPIGYGGSGENWQEKLERAKFYPKIGTAKAQASFWFKSYPTYGCPDVLEFDLNVEKAVVLDIKDETKIKISSALIGRVMSEVTKERMSQSKKGKVRSESSKNAQRGCPSCINVYQD